MNNYQIIIKSHTNYPDYEDTCEADTKEEAARIFERRIARVGGDWEVKQLVEYIEQA